jgi:hypothetical protein
MQVSQATALLVRAIGIGKGKLDTRLHRLALPHFVE